MQEDTAAVVIGAIVLYLGTVDVKGGVVVVIVDTAAVGSLVVRDIRTAGDIDDAVTAVMVDAAAVSCRRITRHIRRIING